MVRQISADALDLHIMDARLFEDEARCIRSGVSVLAFHLVIGIEGTLTNPEAIMETAMPKMINI